MFDDNWILFVFILLVVFGSDGVVAGTELAVLTASVLAILLSENGCLDSWLNRCVCCPN